MHDGAPLARLRIFIKRLQDERDDLRAENERLREELDNAGRAERDSLLALAEARALYEQTMVAYQGMICERDAALAEAERLRHKLNACREDGRVLRNERDAFRRQVRSRLAS